MKRLLLPAILLLPLVLTACDDGADQIASLNTELEAERVKVVELEKRVAEIDGLKSENERLTGELETQKTAAFDTTSIEEPLSVAFVRMRETDRELRSLRQRYGDDPEMLQALGKLRSKLGQAGREIGRIAESAKIDLSSSVGD